uniref:MazG domain-containing protein n=1 Tax=Syphacia muris TaxID=451379 RepID=A0A0N5AK31_9BILA
MTDGLIDLVSLLEKESLDKEHKINGKVTKDPERMLQVMYWLNEAMVQLEAVIEGAENAIRNNKQSYKSST